MIQRGPCVVPDTEHSLKSKLQVKREVISPITKTTFAADKAALLIGKVQDKLATLQVEVSNLDGKVARYHPEYQGILAIETFIAHFCSLTV